jgi:hypothetical protein
MQATELVIKANMCSSKRDVSTSTINSYSTSVRMSILARGQSVIHNYFNYF